MQETWIKRKFSSYSSATGGSSRLNISGLLRNSFYHRTQAPNQQATQQAADPVEQEIWRSQTLLEVRTMFSYCLFHVILLHFCIWNKRDQGMYLGSNALILVCHFVFQILVEFWLNQNTLENNKSAFSQQVTVRECFFCCMASSDCVLHTCDYFINIECQEKSTNNRTAIFPE